MKKSKTGLLQLLISLLNKEIQSNKTYSGVDDKGKSYSGIKFKDLSKDQLEARLKILEAKATDITKAKLYPKK